MDIERIKEQDVITCTLYSKKIFINRLQKIIDYFLGNARPSVKQPAEMLKRTFSHPLRLIFEPSNQEVQRKKMVEVSR